MSTHLLCNIKSAFQGNNTSIYLHTLRCISFCYQYAPSHFNHVLNSFHTMRHYACTQKLKIHYKLPILPCRYVKELMLILPMHHPFECYEAATMNIDLSSLTMAVVRPIMPHHGCGLLPCLEKKKKSAYHTCTVRV